MDKFEELIAGEDKNLALTIFVYLCVIIGLIWCMVVCLYRPLRMCCRYKCCVCGKKNLNKLYGRDDNSAYAVVTGGSDGIGLAMCHNLAE